MKTLVIYGKELPVDGSNYSIEGSEAKLVQTIEPSSPTRSNLSTLALNIDNPEDIVNLVFDNDTEWIGAAMDIPSTFAGEKLRQAEGNEFLIPFAYQQENVRGGFMDLVLKTVNVFKIDKALGREAAESIATKIDKHNVARPGLYRMDSDFEISNEVVKPSGFNTALLFLHGTISSTKGSFSKITVKQDPSGKKSASNVSDELKIKLDQAFNKFDEVLCLEHWTLTKHPIENAIQVLEALPEGVELDIISQSRGGIISDLLAKCDKRNEHIGFHPWQLKKLKKEQPEIFELADQMNQLANRKLIKVNHQLRIASPSNGTSILSKRIDYFFNGVLFAVGKSVGDIFNPFYKILKGFLMEFIRSKANVKVLPGLEAMTPNSMMPSLLNNPSVSAHSKLYVIRGRANRGGIGKNILRLISKAIFWQANDFVVNTASMMRGVQHKDRFYYSAPDDKGESIHHLNYFFNNSTKTALFEFLKDPSTAERFIKFPELEQEQLQNFNRGFRSAALGEEISAKPLVLLIPGMMRTHLFKGKRKVWFHDEALLNGSFVHDMKMDDSNDILPESILHFHYNSIKSKLEEKYKVISFPYDWRLPLKVNAAKLKERFAEILEGQKSCKIIAHETGGLLVKHLMMDFPEFWKEYIDSRSAKVLFMATPWKGTYRIVQDLMGVSDRVNQLASIDTVNSKYELIETYQGFKGILDLLPLDNKNFQDKDWWSSFRDEVGLKNELPDIFKYHLETFVEYSKKAAQFDFDFSKCYYIAGYDLETIRKIDVEEHNYGRSMQWETSNKGDGFSTWKQAIPEDFPKENIYLGLANHSSLLNDEKVQHAVLELLDDQSQTNLLYQIDPDDLELPRELDKYEVHSKELVSAADLIFSNQLNEFTVDGLKSDQLRIDVVHGNLKMAKYPVILGHFAHDGLVSAEGAMDRFLDYRLTDRHNIGRYPTEAHDSEIVIVKDNYPAGAIVIGLGDNTKLTSYILRKSVEKGVVSYAIHLRDNVSDLDIKRDFQHSVSCLAVGTGYGRLSIEEAMSSILMGIADANKLIEVTKGLEVIRNVEFIELFEHRAKSIFYTLKILEEKDTNLNIYIPNQLLTQKGARRNLEYKKDDLWWHDFSTEFKEAKDTTELTQLSFQSSAGMARIEQSSTFASKEIIIALLDEMSSTLTWDDSKAKTLFEIMIPYSLKDIIRFQKNILWKLDVFTASIPWELFHDTEMDESPTFTNAGLIRQLKTVSFRPNPKVNRSGLALIIGDPDLTGSQLSQLPKAKEEAVEVDKMLRKHEFDTILSIDEKGVEILTKLHKHKARILHIASHGIFNPKNPNETGIVIGDNMVISPAMISNLSTVPEFVFINCCNLGEIDPNLEEKYRKGRHQLAANIGTQLIKDGVNAVVVAGWPVHDGAGKLFASTLYDYMLDGESFGKAVQIARKVTYEGFKLFNTWGAYQCYGDPWYSIPTKRSRGAGSSEKKYYTNEEVEIDLFNLLSYTKDDKWGDSDYYLKKLNEIINRAKAHGFYDSNIVELEASILASINRYDLSVSKYIDLMRLEDSNFSVKSLEHFVLLKIINATNGTSGSLASFDPAIKSEINLLRVIGETTSRLNIYGSAMKQFALLDKAENIDEHLNSALDVFERAYLINKDKSEISYSSLVNFLTIHKLREAKNIYEIDGIEQTVEGIIKSKLKRLEKQYKTTKNIVYLKLIIDFLCLELALPETKELSHKLTNLTKRIEELLKIGVDELYVKLQFLNVDFLIMLMGARNHNVLLKVRNEFTKKENSRAKAKEENDDDEKKAASSSNFAGFRGASDEVYQQFDKIVNKENIAKDPYERINTPVRKLLKSGDFMIDVHMHYFDMHCVSAKYLAGRFAKDLFGLRAMSEEAEEAMVDIAYTHEFKEPPAGKEWNDVFMEEFSNRDGGNAGILKHMLNKTTMISVYDQYIKKDSLAQVFPNVPNDNIISTGLLMDLATGWETDKIKKSYPEQVKEMGELSAQRPVLPFLFVDPRRYGLEDSSEELYHLFKQAFENKDNPYFGVKIYPCLGYHPNDFRLWPIYKLCVEYDIPVLSHCGGEIVTTDRKKIMVFDGKIEIPITGKNRKEVGYQLNDPGLWIPVLEQFKTLKLNIAHFGASGAWLDNKKKKLKRKFPQHRKQTILDMVVKYENVYTDLSYSFADKKLIEPLKELMKTEKYRKKILFGTDFWVVYPMGDLSSRTVEFFEKLDNEQWKRELCMDNSMRYLFGAENPFQKTD